MRRGESGNQEKIVPITRGCAATGNVFLFPQHQRQFLSSYLESPIKSTTRQQQHSRTTIQQRVIASLTDALTTDIFIDVLGVRVTAYSLQQHFGVGVQPADVANNLQKQQQQQLIQG